jgi:tryptophan-rich sensory protein
MLVAFYNKVFLVGQSLMPVANALLLGTLMYRSGLVPRVIPAIGLIGVPLQLTAVILTMFGVIERSSTAAGILVIPDFIWELSLGVYLVVKGFKPCPITDAMNAAGITPAQRGVVA